MGRRWWLLFRGLAVPTVLFLAPLLAIQELGPLSYLLSVRGAIAEVALEILAFLLLEALCATVLALVLSAGHALRLWNDRADVNCAGFLAFASAILCGLALLFPLNPIIGLVATAGLQAALILGGSRPAYLLRLAACFRAVQPPQPIGADGTGGLSAAADSCSYRRALAGAALIRCRRHDNSPRAPRRSLT